MEENIDSFVAELRNLTTNYEFDANRDGLILCKIVDDIKSDKVRDTLMRREADLTLQKVIDICREDELTKTQMRLMKKGQEIACGNKESQWRLKKAQLKWRLAEV